MVSKDNDHESWRKIVLDLGGTEAQAASTPEVERSPKPGGFHSAGFRGASKEEPSEDSYPKYRHHRESAEHVSGAGPRDYVVDDHHEDFIPHQPPPLGTGSPRIVLSWATVMGLPLIVGIIALLGVRFSFWLWVGVILAMFAGSLSLFMLIPTDRDRREAGTDPDDLGDGARF